MGGNRISVRKCGKYKKMPAWINRDESARAGRRSAVQPYFAGSRRAVHLISAGWQAIPMLEQFTVSSASRRQERH
jgi:hypothetical protein